MAFSHRHLIIAFLVIIMACIALGIASSKEVQAKHTVIPWLFGPQLAMPTPDENKIKAPIAVHSALEPPSSALSPLNLEAWTTIDIRSGDNLSTLFQRAKLNSADLHELITSTPEAKHLAKIYPNCGILVL